MTLYGAEVTEQAAPLVIALGIVALVFSGIEMLIDVLVPPQRQYWKHVSKGDVKSHDRQKLAGFGEDKGQVIDV